MSRLRLKNLYRRGLPVCTTAALLAALPTAAQEAGLRGTIEAPSLSDSLVLRLVDDNLTTGATESPTDDYRPASAGALPEDQDADLFEDDSAAGDTGSFLSNDAPSPSRRPSTAREREEQREGRQTLEAEETAPDEERETDDVTTGTTPAGTVDANEDGEETGQRQNRRARAIEGLSRPREEDPYAPVGLRIGTFNLVTTLEQGLTWTSNVDSSPDPQEAVLSETTLRLNAESDWSRHRAALNAYGTFREPLSGESESELEGGGDALLELELADGVTGRGTLAYSVGRESASSPVIIVGVAEQPLRHSIDASLGLERSLGRLRLGVTGELSRNQYGDALLSDDTTLSQSDRNATLALVKLRGGYEISPALTPYIELEGGYRFYDEKLDSAGYERSALRLGGRAGVVIEISEKLSGEVSAGWLTERFEDDRLEAVSAPTLAAAMQWSPQRGTNMKLDASTTVEGSTDAGDSGSLLYAGTVGIERQLRANLTGELAFGTTWRDYSGGGHDLVLSGEASLTWWLNRYAALTGRARHERQTSSLPNRDYEETSVFLGMKLQR